MERAIEWSDGAIVAVDQRALPHQHRILSLGDVDELIEAIRHLAIRGAPAIGIAAGLGVALSARCHTHAEDGAVDEAAVRADAQRLSKARPTAVHLTWAVQRVLDRVPDGPDAVLAEALAMLDEDERINRAAAHRAAELIRQPCPDDKLRILTHCNTGALATAGWGTALGAIRELAEAGLVESVLVNETRPLLQGARLTVWELAEAGIGHRLCVDTAGVWAVASGRVDCVIVGADRVAANGDVANKIGTYALACAADRHRVPFIVVAPESTIDPTTPDGAAIVIEQRPAEEVTGMAGVPITVADTQVFNPAFDVTPNHLVTAVVTESRRYPTRGADQFRAAVAEVTRSLYRRGWMEGTSGNVSIRLPDTADLAVITASGCSKGQLTAADTVLVVATSGEQGGTCERRPSAETLIHAALYRAFPDCGAVIHAHCPYATLAASRAESAGRRVVRFAGWELIKGLAVADPAAVEVPVFPNWPQVPQIAADVAEYYAVAGRKEPTVLLIAHHGATAWGPTLELARNRLECLEALCRLSLMADVESKEGPP